MASQETISLVLRLAVSVAISYVTWRAIKEIIEPNRKEKQEAEKRSKQLLQRLGIKTTVKLSDHEMFVAQNLVEPDSVGVSWEDIGGLDDQIAELRRTVLMPLQKRPDIRVSSLVQPPKGVLLYGPPGCGKTMLAKAMAREADARFINLQLSTLTDKWYGESQKLAAAVFTLAEKIQPVIIFIDEIDAFLRVRDRGDHEVTAMMKAQFLSLWDGLISDSASRIVILGATNRPQDVDDAIRRRLPCSFRIGLPNPTQRLMILRKILAGEELSPDLELEIIAAQTDNYSGSDLQELCRKAAVRCYLRAVAQNDLQLLNSLNDVNVEETGADSRITMEDFQTALC
ncbi:ATPase family AAA domain-containing protein 1-B [Hypsibius exemplaris]|uniref:ATPase family AAA domain-containing protein 1-B n=1 Tax=Hypsibius exemplaris TaxID=2072580 RepID=A0A1W0XBS9_HYPEX|nr:ATPase family AAA domain-containing protein 1-B [Hypsibius exemplaris]